MIIHSCQIGHPGVYIMPKYYVGGLVAGGKNQKYKFSEKNEKGRNMRKNGGKCLRNASLQAMNFKIFRLG